MGTENDDLESELNFGASPIATPRPRTPEIPLQNPFMPSSTPEHLNPRYLCWNEVGVIRRYGSLSDEDSVKSIEVEFHDAFFHNSMMIQNYHDYFLGSLSKGALVVANSRYAYFYVARVVTPIIFLNLCCAKTEYNPHFSVSSRIEKNYLSTAKSAQFP